MQVLSLVAKPYPDMREQSRKKGNAMLFTLSYMNTQNKLLLAVRSLWVRAVLIVVNKSWQT